VRTMIRRVSLVSLQFSSVLLSSLLSLSVAHAALPYPSVVPHDEAYYTQDVRNTRLIYTEENLPFARQTAEIQLSLQPLYEQMFGYQMDDILNVGLASRHNQIANGFSTQWPRNRQINYVGGALAIDYFSSPSWLKTLIYHETCHNYQLNAKGSDISKGLHSVLGNGSVFVPWFTVPNIVESSFLLEGNAVLNESWHGNGGRLYSGRFKAATLQQAKAGYLTAERVYNANYYFLYGSHFYTLGGYYQYYLAGNYGLEATNNYWQTLSKNWLWPFTTSNATRDSIGIDFHTAFDGWRVEMEAAAESLSDVEGDAVASTQFFSPMNADRDEIYFIVNESGRGFPELVTYDRASGQVVKDTGSYAAGKVIRLADGRYVTQAGLKTSPWRIHQGLFDEDAMIIDGTQSKIVEGFLTDGTEVYFDVPASYDQPQLYVGDAFYARTNSSVIIDGDDLYYFAQGQGKSRTMYRNRQALFTIQGYYSYPSGVDSKGAVYFIANTEHGSGLFRFYDGRLSRAHQADTIFDARLIDDNSALVAVMGADEYSYNKIELSDIDEAPHEVVLFVENQPYYRAADPALHPQEIPDITLDDDYYSFLDMDYSATNITFANDKDAGFIYDIDITFSDPLTQNALSAFVLRNTDEFTLAGLSYANIQYFLQYSLSAYGIIDRPDDEVPQPDERDSGIVANAYVPLLESGHYDATFQASYYQDYDSNSRKPLSFVLDMKRSEQYGVSFYRNFLLQAAPYTSSDRDDTTNGGVLGIEYGLPAEWYLGMHAQYSASDASSPVDERGVKLTANPYSRFQDSDPTTVTMLGLKSTTYFKTISRANLRLSKVFNLAKYFFRFPLSLRREALFVDYNRYELEPFAARVKDITVNETVIGLDLDLVAVSKLPIPVSLQYIYNDNELLADRESFRVLVAFTF